MMIMIQVDFDDATIWFNEIYMFYMMMWLKNIPGFMVMLHNTTGSYGRTYVEAAYGEIWDLLFLWLRLFREVTLAWKERSGIAMMHRLMVDIPGLTLVLDKDIYSIFRF